MLETVRQYAAEKLVDQGEGERLRVLHLKYFMEWVEELEPRLRGPEQLAWLDAMEAEHDNIRSGLNWCLGSGDAEWGLRLAVASYWFWHPRGYWREGVTWLRAILDQLPEDVWTPVRAKALVVAASLALEWSPIDAVGEDYDGCLKYWQEVGDDWWSAFALTVLGWYFVNTNDAVCWTGAVRGGGGLRTQVERSLDPRLYPLVPRVPLSSGLIWRPRAPFWKSAFCTSGRRGIAGLSPRHWTN